MTVDQPKQGPLELSATERAWLAEVRRRDGEMESGAVASVPLDEALASVRARFGW